MFKISKSLVLGLVVQTETLRNDVLKYRKRVKHDFGKRNVTKSCFETPETLRNMISCKPKRYEIDFRDTRNVVKRVSSKPKHYEIDFRNTRNVAKNVFRTNRNPTKRETGKMFQENETSQNRFPRHAKRGKTCFVQTKTLQNRFLRHAIVWLIF